MYTQGRLASAYAKLDSVYIHKMRLLIPHSDFTQCTSSITKYNYSFFKKIMLDYYQQYLARRKFLRQALYSDMRRIY